VSSVKQSAFPLSWVPPCYLWTNSNEVFALEVETSYLDVVAFIATGSHEFEIFATKKQSLAIAAIIGRKSLRGHQKRTGPDQRAFILPTRDPVSTGVFNTFLHHVVIDKASYLRSIRPNL